VVFGVVAVGGAVAGALGADRVSEPVLLAAFAVLMLLVGVLMTVRQLRPGTAQLHARSALGDPIITFDPTFACACPRALKVLVTATVVGLLTGFLGVGGGFLIVPALVLALALPMQYAVGTSLVVIVTTSAAALLVRAGSVVQPDWWLVLVLTGASAVGGYAGVRVAERTDTRRLSRAFTALVLTVAAYTASRALPALI
jgi:uncharacterized membrane protein YfcA